MRKVITEDGELLPDPPIEALPVTSEQIDACIERHQGVLINEIRSGQFPSDGTILTMIQTIEALKKLKGEIA